MFSDSRLNSLCVSSSLQNINNQLCKVSVKARLGCPAGERGHHGIAVGKWEEEAAEEDRSKDFTQGKVSKRVDDMNISITLYHMYKHVCVFWGAGNKMSARGSLPL